MKRYYDDEALRLELRQRLEGRSQRELAGELGLHEELLSVFLRGSRPAPPALLRALGLERIVLYAAP